MGHGDCGGTLAIGGHEAVSDHLKVLAKVLLPLKARAVPISGAHIRLDAHPGFTRLEN